MRITSPMRGISFNDDLFILFELIFYCIFAKGQHQDDLI